jgi:hypothetical protein
MPAAIEPVKLIPLVQAEDKEPLVYRDLPRGDTPMLGNWKTLALYSLMTATVVVQAPAPAAAQDNKALKEGLDNLQESVKKGFENAAVDVATVKNDLKKIREELDLAKEEGLKQRLAMGSATTKIDALEKAVEKLKTELETLRTREPSIAKSGIDKEMVEQINSRLAAIESAIAKLQPATKRIALSPPGNLPPTTGRVVLINTYSEHLLFIINNKPYRVEPGTNRFVDDVPAGAMTWEVMSDRWGLRGRNTVTLSPNELFALTAAP